jgi:SOS response associated peptidase (SRAP)
LRRDSPGTLHPRQALSLTRPHSGDRHRHSSPIDRDCLLELVNEGHYSRVAILSVAQSTHVFSAAYYSGVGLTYQHQPTVAVPFDRSGVSRHRFTTQAFAQVHARGPINGRAETVANSCTSRSALDRLRCIVPADVFYEWKPSEGGKQPLRHRAGDGQP